MMNITRLAAIRDFIPDESQPASPFRYHQDNNIRKQTLETGISAVDLMSDPVNTAVLGTVNKLLCATEYHTADALTAMGVACKYSDIRNRMFRMAGTGLLDHFQYNCEGHTYPHSFFCVGEMGCKVLASYGRKADENPYLPTGEPVRIMRLLAVNQFLTKTHFPVDTVQIGVKVGIPGNAYCTFRPQAVAEQDGKTLFLEGVRRENNWGQNLLKKLARVEAVVNNASGTRFSMHNPCMVLIGEDTIHCREIMNQLAGEDFPFGLLYTADDLVFRSPDSCLFEVEEEPQSKPHEGLGFWRHILGFGS